MLQIRKSTERGVAEFGWLSSRHTFSFGEYHDPRHMGFGPLRVINEDRVAPGKGFGTHGHRDMEIISYVLEGALAHKDSIGTGSIIRPGDVQIMSAGSGIQHSEFNSSATEPVHFLQIWIVPDRQGIAPRYAQERFPDEEKSGRLRLIGSPDGRDGSIVVYQDVRIFSAVLKSGDSVTHDMAKGRRVWVQIVRGAATVEGQAVEAGDGVAAQDEPSVALTAMRDGTELLVFDLP